MAKIDWLNSTFPAPSMSVLGVAKFLGSIMGERPIDVRLDGGLFGFEERYRLRVYVNGSVSDVGAIARGGVAQRGRWLLQLTGKGCGLVEDWESLRELLEGFGAKLTRVDVAVDFLDGLHTVDEAVEWAKADGFGCGGRRPSTSVAGDWLDGERGRTLYVGSASNGKLLRVYEKGKQLGDAGSDWTRFEVQLGNRDRVIPFDVLTDPGRFFTGAYPALASLLGAAAERIPTVQTEAKTSLCHLLYHLKRSFGKTIDAAVAMTGVDYTELVDELRVIGIPRRLKPSGVVAGADWAGVRARIRSYT